MSSAWGLVSRWEVAEPTRHRTPIPEPLVKAALSWGWPNFATVVLACFYGICRIGEVLKAQRKELLTPVDLMTEEQVVYLRIVAPKSRRRGAAVQYTTIDDPLAVRLISRIWQQLDSSSRLFSISPGSFRRRWDSILYVLGVGKEHGITPGSLRGGGAVCAHKRGVHIQDLLWKMRLQHARTLGYYLQETTAVSLLPMLSFEKREAIRCLQGLLPFFIEAPELCRTSPNVTSAHGFSWLTT